MTDARAATAALWDREIEGLYLALWQAPEKAALSIIHDYEGVAKSDE